MSARAGGKAQVGERRMADEEAVHIVHVDMDAFFAAVEVLDDPSLEGLPVVVGGQGERGVVASASYEARRFGIHSAMAMAEARRLCPELVAIEGRHDRYREVSARLMVLLRRVTPYVEPVSLDEAYLDVAGALHRGGPPEALARRLREAVRGELALACSVGAGRTKLVAKLASKAAKPRTAEPSPTDGVLVVEPADEGAFLGAHRVRALPGVGPRTAEKLARYGVETVADLALVDVGSLVRLLGRAHGTLLHELAHGRDPRRVEPDRPIASIGHEETFPRDQRSPEHLTGLVAEMAQAVAARCRRAEVAPRRVTVKVRYADFATATRSRTLPRPARSGQEIGEVAAQLLSGFAIARGVRLLGVHASLLAPLQVAGASACQLSLLAAPDDGAPQDRRHEEVEIASDEIRRRYGDDAIAPLGVLARRGRDVPPRTGLDR